MRVVSFTERAQRELRPREVLVFDWHRVAICCAAAGEVSLRRTTAGELDRRSATFVPLPTVPGAPPVFAHRRAYPHLVGRTIEVDCRRRLGMRHFVSDLPNDFGLRASLGRLPVDAAPGGHS
jgi:hypothetical protein